MKTYKVKIPAISAQEITEEAKSKDELRKSIFENLTKEIERKRECIKHYNQYL